MGTRLDSLRAGRPTTASAAPRAVRWRRFRGFAIMRSAARPVTRGSPTLSPPYIPFRIPSRCARDITRARVNTPHDESRHGLANARPLLYYKAGPRGGNDAQRVRSPRGLVEHRGEVVTWERFLDEVWTYERLPTTRTVDTHMLRLRRKLEADADHPAWIPTVHAQGYRFATS
jgi:hypothetical protein